jgi:hypothetical protein
MPETIRRDELASILERNGYHTAAADILNGVDAADATNYLSSLPPYDDGEGRWVAALRSNIATGAVVVID